MAWARVSAVEMERSVWFWINLEVGPTEGGDG